MNANTSFQRSNVAREQRSVWIDSTKGILIGLVVYGHSARGLEGAGKINFSGMWGLVDYAIYTMHMPGFFLLSGIFFDRSLRQGYGRYGQRLLTRFVWPYFFWSFAQVTAQWLGGRFNLTNHDIDFRILTNIIWHPVSPFWFIYALLFSSIISALLSKISPYVVASLSLAILVVLSVYGEVSVLYDIAYGLFYFSLGRKINDIFLIVDRNPNIISIIAMIVLFILSVMAGYYCRFPSRLNVPAAVFAFLAIYTALKLGENSRIQSFLAFIGRKTFSIYVMHITVIAVTRGLCLKVFGDSPAVIILFQVILGVSLPVAVQILLNKLNWAWCFGLEEDRPAPKLEKKTTD